MPAAPVRIVPFSWRVGVAYRQTHRLLARTERWAPDQLATYQEGLLAATLDRALQRVPHYARRYGHLRGRPARSVLREIEPVSKSTVQAQPDDFVDPTVPSAEWYEASTGGTSGVPLRIRLDRRGFQVEWAFMVDQWSRAGFRPGMRRATFRGKNFASRATLARESCLRTRYCSRHSRCRKPISPVT